MPGRELIQSVLRAADILEVLSSAPGGLSLGDLCSRLGLKGPTVHNLLRTLMSRRLVERQASPVRYRLGSRLGELSARQEHLGLDRQCEDLLRAVVVGGTAEAVHMARQAAGEVVVVLRLDASRPHLAERPAARALHPYGSCAALVFQAYASRAEVESYRRAHPFAVFAGSLWSSEAALEDELERIRTGGCCVQATSEALRVGVPYVGRRGQLEGILGASRSLDGQRAGVGGGQGGGAGVLVEALQDCARRLALTSGYSVEA